VLASAGVHETEMLTGLWIAGELRGRARPLRLATRLAPVVPFLPVLWGLLSCWTARSVVQWIGDLLFTLALYVFVVGVGAVATVVGALVARGAGRRCRRVGRPAARAGHSGGIDMLLTGIVVLVAIVAVLVNSRPHRWPVVRGGGS
jgi:hypothetical protein